MSDFKLPDLPSDDELGITEEDRKDLHDEAPELSEQERRALGLGEPPQQPPPPPPADKATKSSSRPPSEKPKKSRPPAPEQPPGAWRGPVMLVLLVAAAWFSSPYRTLPAPVPANAPDADFSSARAMAMDVEIARHPHPTGSPAHAEVRAYVMDRLSALGLEPHVQTATSILSRRSTVRAATVRNIVARVPGTESTGAILLAAHYDGAGIARAAADDGAGVVAILEALRALRSGGPLRNDVIVLITDAEELGLLGAQSFVEEHPWMSEVALVLNLEMRGAGGPALMFETGADNGWVVSEMREARAGVWANSMSVEVYRRMPNDTDFTRFRQAGKQGLNLAAIGRASIYHQSYDQPSNLSEATLQHHGETLLRLTRHFGDLDLGAVEAPDATWFTLPVLGLVVHPSAMALPIGAWMLLLAVLVLLPVARRQGWAAPVVGLGVGFVSAGLTGLAGYGLLRWLPRFHPEYGSLVGSVFHHEGWYVLALVGIGLFFVTASFGLARRWMGLAGLAWGALLLPLAAAAWLSLAVPAAAPNLQWPVMAAYLGTGVLLVGSGSRTVIVAWLLSALLALPVLAFVEPMAELLWLGMSFAAAPALGALIGTGLLLLLPALGFLREPNPWWAPVVSLLFAVSCVALGIRAAAPSPERPAPSTLAWTWDHGTQEASWVTAGDSASSAGAEEWLAARVGSSFAPVDSLPAFPTAGRVASAPALALPAVEAWIVTDSTVAGIRHLRVAVRSAIGAELLQLRPGGDGPVRIGGINGRPLPGDTGPRLVEHWGVPDPAVLVDLELPAGEPLALTVLEHHFRPGELVGTEYFQRPPELAPDVTRQSDRAVVRTPALELRDGPPPFSLDPTPFPSPGIPGGRAPAAAPDSVPAVADTSAAGRIGPAGPDTGAAARDTSIAPPDTMRILP